MCAEPSTPSTEYCPHCVRALAVAEIVLRVSRENQLLFALHEPGQCQLSTEYGWLVK